MVESNSPSAPFKKHFNLADLDEAKLAQKRQQLDPDRALHLLDLAPGQHVADVGAGIGFFSLPVARRVLPGGRVTAYDIAPEHLTMLMAYAAREGVTGITTAVNSENHLPGPDGDADAALVCSVLHQAVDPPALAREVYRILRPGGQLLVIDYHQGAAVETGPPVALRPGQEAVAGWLEGAGFAIARRTEIARGKFALVARKPVPSGE